MELALGIVAVVVVVVIVAGATASRSVSAPLALTVVGFAGSYLPFVPDYVLDPDLVLIGLLPPLLYAAALRTSIVDFRNAVRPIALLSVGLVIFSATVVGLVAWWVVPGIPFAAAFALGAVVAPPDAVAATSIARRVGMPRRVVTILEGESLVNDATALVLLRTAVAAVGTRVAAVHVGLTFVWAAVGGVLVGLALSWLLSLVRRRVHDPVVDTTLSFLAPFIAYLPAEQLQASGVLAVVVTGLALGHKAPAVQSASSRLSEQINWRTVQFVLENVVFLLIGLQVRTIVEGANGTGIGTMRLVGICVAVFVAVVVARPVWVFPATYLSRLIPRVALRDPAPPWTYPAVISWAGMRGVVTLAAAFSLPEETPQREVLVLAAFVVVAASLLVQGSTLPGLVRWLQLPGPSPQEDALQEATVLQAATQAGLERLDAISGEESASEALGELRSRSQRRSEGAWERLGRGSDNGETPSETYYRLRLEMLRAEREKVLELRSGGTLADDVVRRVLLALDSEEATLDRVEQAGQALRDGDALVAPSQPGECEHLDSSPEVVEPRTPQGCEDCLREGTTWVHLRLCLDCGKVGCCDSSQARHAERHFHDVGHPVMRSFEPGEAWRWCYVDRLVG